MSTAAPTPLVRLIDVSVRHGFRTALANLNLTIHRGEHLAILGGNGAGKSTLLRVIAGELWPTPVLDGPGAGTVGERWYHWSAGAPESDAITARERIRLVGPELQDRYVARGRSLPAWQVVASGLDDGPLPRRRLDERTRLKLRKSLLRTGSQQLADRQFLELSRGEQRRILIARALMSEPDIVCLDEIGDGLDSAGLRRFLQLLDRIAEQGTTLVMATHHPDELPAVVHRRLYLENGRRVAAPSATSMESAGTLSLPTAVPESAGANALIRIEGADVYRGRRRVLTGLDWTLMPGQRWLIRGDNGAGKSTFIRLLNGELRPGRRGCIRWFDFADVPNVWEVRRRIGLVSDDLQAAHALGQSVAQCVATGFVASIGRVPRLSAQEAEAVSHWMRVLDLDELRNRPVRGLSYGQLRRVLLARALVKSPDVLLLDEPASGLDAESRRTIRGVLEEAARQGVAIVMTAHRDELGVVGDGLFLQGATIRDGRLRVDV